MRKSGAGSPLFMLARNTKTMATIKQLPKRAQRRNGGDGRRARRPETKNKIRERKNIDSNKWHRKHIVPITRLQLSACAKGSNKSISLLHLCSNRAAAHTIGNISVYLPYNVYLLYKLLYMLYICVLFKCAETHETKCAHITQQPTRVVHTNDQHFPHLLPPTC